MKVNHPMKQMVSTYAWRMVEEIFICKMMNFGLKNVIQGISNQEILVFL